MRRWTRLLLGTLLLAGTAPAAAHAAPAEWTGTLTIESTIVGPLLEATGDGVGLFSSTNPTPHLRTLRIEGSVAGSNAVPVTDPDVSITYQTLEISATLGSGTFGGITPGGPVTRNTLPVRGELRFCILVPGCSVFVPIALTANSGQTGFGVGGTLAQGSFNFKISLFGAPWTVATATVSLGTGPVESRVGFVHGPASLTSSTALPSGVLQLVTPSVAVVDLGDGPVKTSLFGTLTLHFVPEPGPFLLLATGALSLALFGWQRRR